MFAGLARWIGFLTMAAGATAIILLAVGFGWFRTPARSAPLTA